MSDKRLQVEMHKDFFDRCEKAIETGFYFEAMLMEYAAIESRLEIIMGLIGLPCNKDLTDKERRSINISDRLSCLQSIQEHTDLFANSKLPRGFFEKMKKWIDKRNVYIHGLYKNELQYKNRMKNIIEIANKGNDYCHLLYNETKRLRRLAKSDSLLEITHTCNKSSCFNVRNKNNV